MASRALQAADDIQVVPEDLVHGARDKLHEGLRGKVAAASPPQLGIDLSPQALHQVHQRICRIGLSTHRLACDLHVRSGLQRHQLTDQLADARR